MVWFKAAGADDIAEEGYFCTPYLAFVSIEAKASFTCTFYDSSQVCIMVTEVTAVDNYIVSNTSETGEVTKCLVYFLLEDILGAD